MVVPVTRSMGENEVSGAPTLRFGGWMINRREGWSCSSDIKATTAAEDGPCFWQTDQSSRGPSIQHGCQFLALTSRSSSHPLPSGYYNGYIQGLLSLMCHSKRGRAG